MSPNSCQGKPPVVGVSFAAAAAPPEGRGWRGSRSPAPSGGRRLSPGPSLRHFACITKKPMTISARSVRRGAVMTVTTGGMPTAAKDIITAGVSATHMAMPSGPRGTNAENGARCASMRFTLNPTRLRGQPLTAQLFLSPWDRRSARAPPGRSWCTAGAEDSATRRPSSWTRQSRRWAVAVRRFTRLERIRTARTPTRVPPYNGESMRRRSMRLHRHTAAYFIGCRHPWTSHRAGPAACAPISSVPVRGAC